MSKSTLFSLMLVAGFTAGFTAQAQTPLAKISSVAGNYAPAAHADDDDDDEIGYYDYSGDTFKSLGTGTFRDEIVAPIFGGASYVGDVEIEESQEHPGVYRLVEPYKDFSLSGYELLEGNSPYLYVNASDPDAVYMEFFFTGVLAKAELSDGTTEIHQIKIGSMAGDYQYRYGRVSGMIAAKDEGITGKLRHGNITFPRNTLLGVDVKTDDHTVYDPLLIWKPYNERGLFLITMPDAPDLTGSVSVGQLIADGETFNIPVSASFSADVDEARITLVKSDYSLGAAEEIYQKLIDGSIEYKTVTRRNIQQSKNIVTFPFDGSSAYTAYMVTFADGEEMATFYNTRELRNDTNWKSFEDEYALFTEPYLSDNVNLYDEKVGWTGWMTARERQVMFEQSTDNSGMIRLVNPYSGQAPTYYEYSMEAGAYDYDRFYYIYIDLTDHDRVQILSTDNGIGLTSVAGMNGQIHVSSRAYRYMTTGGPIYDDLSDKYYWGIWDEDMVTAANLWGKYDDETKTVTFPIDALCVNFKANPADAWYEANHTGVFKLVLPSSFSSVDSIMTDETVDADAPVEYYNLQGMQVANPEQGRIYIKRQGTKVTKVRF